MKRVYLKSGCQVLEQDELEALIYDSDLYSYILCRCPDWILLEQDELEALMI